MRRFIRIPLSYRPFHKLGVTSQLDWTLVSKCYFKPQPNLFHKEEVLSLLKGEGSGEVAKTLTTEILLKNQTIKPSLSILD